MCSHYASLPGTGSALADSPAAWPRRLAIKLIGGYRRYVSPYSPPSCRFTPTCSRYAVDAFRRYGVVLGAWLSLWRILRCNPIHRGGYDPLR